MISLARCVHWKQTRLKVTKRLLKVIFGRQGAVAGILGTADVGVMVKGLPVEPGRVEGMVLSDLPFKGSVRVGQKSL